MELLVIQYKKLLVLQCNDQLILPCKEVLPLRCMEVSVIHCIELLVLQGSRQTCIHRGKMSLIPPMFTLCSHAYINNTCIPSRTHGYINRSTFDSTNHLLSLYCTQGTWEIRKHFLLTIFSKWEIIFTLMFNTKKMYNYNTLLQPHLLLLLVKKNHPTLLLCFNGSP